MQKNKTKQIQAEILSIYKDIKKICERNNIRFYAVGGTELGAVRHHGFIPWDDDMDLGIPIEDFEKFKKACKKELPRPLEFLESHWMGGKVHNKDTTFLEAPCVFDISQYHGIFVDIFPIIGIPNDPTARKQFLLDMRKYRGKAFTFDRYPESSTLSKNEILNWKRHIVGVFPCEASKRLAMFSTGHYFFMDPNGLKNPLEMPFENTTIPVSSNYDLTLRMHYGDYKKLPPKEQRFTHDENAIVDFNTPCKEYYKKVTQIDPSILKLLRAKHKMEGSLQDTLYAQDILQEEKDHKLTEANREIKRLHAIINRTPTAKAKHVYKKLKKLIAK